MASPTDRPPAGALSALASVVRAAAEDRTARRLAALHVLDWLGNAAYGSTCPAGEAMARWLAAEASGPVATLAGRVAEASAAAAYHGALGSLLEMDDVHRSSVLHPGPVVVPAAWSCAMAGGDGAAPRFLAAVVGGCEAMIRIGRALGPGHYRFWHPTSTAGSFGAAAAASIASGLDDAQTAQAMALAGTRAGGLWQVRHESSFGKAWHMAGAARDGVTAARLAAAGMTGPLAVLEGPSGWFVATAADADPTRLLEPRATPWLDDVSFKPWPACRHAHPAMDALWELLQTHPTTIAEVQRIEVHGYADALRFCDRTEPQDEAQARFSIQHALAAWLRWGTPQLAHYQGDALHDAAVRALRPHIVLHEDAAIQARYPQHYGARVLVQRTDGRTLQAEVRDTHGDPARPMSEAAIQAKAAALMAAAGWAGARIDAAIAACAALPEAGDLAALRAVIIGGTR
jgi:2-methylcitrate dehydratase PrpD